MDDRERNLSRCGLGGEGGGGKQSKKENKTRRDKEENRFKRKNEGQ